MDSATRHPSGALINAKVLGLTVATFASLFGFSEPSIAVSVRSPSAQSPSTQQPKPSTATRLRHGIDLSEHSGEVNWDLLAQHDFDFVFLKTTEGVDLADSAFDDHWKGAERIGLVRGAYHFYVTEDDPEEQAEFFINRAPLESGDLVPVVDIELLGHGTQSGLAQRLRTFLDALEKHYGVKPIIYTSPNFWNEHLDGSFGDYPLWVAEYGVDAPRIPVGWETWSLWQWEDDSDVKGVEKDADLSRVHPDVDVKRLLVP